MSQDPLFPAFAIFMAATVAWLALVWRLFTLMKARTPDAYASIGQPHVILKNTISNNLLFMRFLLGGGYANVNDDGVRKLCAFLRVFFWCYLVGFIAFGAAVFVASGPRI
jgi:hypothetical protein